MAQESSASLQWDIVNINLDPQGRLRMLARIWSRIRKNAPMLVALAIFGILYYFSGEFAVGYAAVLLTFTVFAFALSLFDFCFTRGKEGAAKMVVLGSAREGVFDHMLMWWRGHYPNDPRRSWYDSSQPAWEVLTSPNPIDFHSAYAWWELHWKWLEFWGVYWYGLRPIKNIYTYKFKWIEQGLGNKSEPVPVPRNEYTNLVFVNNFTYWGTLVEAEDEDNEPLDLEYLLTVRINNPPKAIFDIGDWLGRTIADANNAGKIYVGDKTFDEVKREKLSSTSMTGEFAASILAINDNSTTETGMVGTKLSYGTTITAVSLVEVTIEGENRSAIVAATTARVVAERHAEATVATAKGEADAMRERARGQADAISTVYDQVTSRGEPGLRIRQMEALENTASSQNNTSFVWANSPLGPLASVLEGIMPKPATPEPAPTSPPTTPTTETSMG